MGLHLNWGIVDGLTLDCHIGESWQIGQGLAMDRHRIGNGLASDGHRIGTRLASDWH